ncbi:undecaprenyl-diphosphate phosphatase [Nostocoides australiense]|uniref:Undecaprenyl-diphosphatase n=1 Tax=Nostocoides australiense Ben110 TaxID=1193182 RepID=W6JZH8_9MICO|nr:undecaprenyl-diphosphate phosphatase [Tetrasphaera australiensis]MCA0292153.1 undecaprenyl-diphosphate phosphatase [Actinomycetota bacterium]MCB1299877.1 undecaprenyl-diphosphate phosphatase [Tetrasphaera sp.]CCH74607.1 Undecaprenyl-diphosphatase 3 [Tetrasphaera australiensis Ben110]HPF80071.1 undecaprenyl-diphosphate phosphatase [Tetrasphaera australiensis]HRW02394.1 undecaprenyl-diphosphate phosphatase [Tetrasphaera sp.]
MLSYFDAVVLGIVEGLTEFLPVSSTGHLTVAEKMLGLRVDDKAVTAYTVIIQFGAIVATFIYFAKKIARLFMAWVRGLTNADARGHDYTLAWAVIVGSIPVGIAGFLGKDLIAGPLRNLWVVAAALVLWSAVMVWAEKRHDALEAAGDQRGEGQVTMRDGIMIGLMQCFSLIPGVSRSGATISAGLLRGIDRVTATELSFFMAIPALTAGGVFEALQERDTLGNLGFGQMAVGMLVAFVVAYASIAWLLKFVATNSLMAFVSYRVVAGLALAAALGVGWIAAT